MPHTVILMGVPTLTDELLKKIHEQFGEDAILLTELQTRQKGLLKEIPSTEDALVIREIKKMELTPIRYEDSKVTFNKRDKQQERFRARHFRK